MKTFTKVNWGISLQQILKKKLSVTSVNVHYIVKHSSNKTHVTTTKRIVTNRQRLFFSSKKIPASRHMGPLFKIWIERKSSDRASPLNRTIFSPPAGLTNAGASLTVTPGSTLQVAHFWGTTVSTGGIHLAKMYTEKMCVGNKEQCKKLWSLKKKNYFYQEY